MLKIKYELISFNQIFLLIKKLKHLAIEQAKDSEYLFVPLGIIGFIGYASYYVIWREITPLAYESMSLRLIAIFLCSGLAFKNFWPVKFRPYLSAYWYFTLFYIFPFFYSFMLLKNNFSPVWVQNSMTGLFFLIVLLNWIELIVILLLGIFFGGLVYLASTNTSIIIPNSFTANIFAYIAPIGIAAMFFYAKEQKQKEKLEAMKLLGASIAHELRTPFAALSLASSGMRKYFNNLIDGYKLAKQANLPVSTINPVQLELLEKIPETIDKESKAANLFIDLLINNINPDIKKETNNFVSINTCIKQSLERYPFSEEQKLLIHWQDNNDFTVKGDEILIIHLLFNLIKNALYYLAKAGKKSEKGIYIWTEKTTSGNKLYFKDTGTGIAKDILPFIFNRFFSKTKHGSGIGLTYCKMVMESLGGSISCESEINDYTLFIMTFPVINN